MEWIFQLLIIITFILVIYWVLFGERKQKELLSKGESERKEKNKTRNNKMSNENE